MNTLVNSSRADSSFRAPRAHPTDTEGLFVVLMRRRSVQIGLMLVLATFCCVLLVAFRVWRTGSITYLFLLWNLALAWVPMQISCLLNYGHHRNMQVPAGNLILLGIWFLFFPNAPYIVTDLIHLIPRYPIPVWYDLMVIVFNAWTGFALAVCSLYQMQTLIARRFGRPWGWVLVAVTIPATGLGIYIGRFLDWNSWDIMLAPTTIIRNVVADLLNAPSDPTAVAVSVLFSVLLGLTYGIARIAAGTDTPSNSDIQVM